MVRHGEDVKGAKLGELPPLLAGGRDISSECCGIARDVDDCPGPEPHYSRHDIPTSTDARRIQDDDVAASDPASAQPLLDSIVMYVNRRLPMEGSAGTLDSNLIALDRVDAPTGTGIRRKGTREEAHPGVEIDDVIARTGLSKCADGVHECICGTGMHLPEGSGVEMPLTSGRLLGDSGPAGHGVGEDDRLRVRLNGENLPGIRPRAAEDVRTGECR